MGFSVDKMKEVLIGNSEVPGFGCSIMSTIECIATNGYINFENGERLIYIECLHNLDYVSKCAHMKALLNCEYSEGGVTVKYRRGQKGQIMEDILEEFEKSDIAEIRIPVKVNLTEENTKPSMMIRGLAVLQDQYETSLDGDVVAMIGRDEPVDKYMLTVRKRFVEEGRKKKGTFRGFFGKGE